MGHRGGARAGTPKCLALNADDGASFLEIAYTARFEQRGAKDKRVALVCQ